MTMTVEGITDWFQRKRATQLGADRAVELYFTFHPRTAFLKTLPANAAVVDIGAGDGSLSVFRRWPAPAREDLRLFAYALEEGRMFGDFEAFEIGDWNRSPPEFGSLRFDAAVCAHFIEHIQDPASLVAWAQRKLVPGGRLYLEWPAPASLSLPPRDALERAGVPLVISRFDDDHTHQALPDRHAMLDAFEACGFAIEATGTVRLPWLEDELLAHFHDASDPFPRQAAFWSHTGWSQYIVAERR